MASHPQTSILGIRVPMLMALWIDAFMRRWLKPRLPMIYQVETTECALACLAMVSSYHGQHRTLADLRELHPGTLQGLNLNDVHRVCGSINLSVRAIRCNLESLRRLALPALLHWDLEHFVVLRRLSRRGGATIHDPARGIMRVSDEELSRSFTGIAVEISPTKSLAFTSPAKKYTLVSFLSSFGGFLPAIGRIAYLALLVELATLAAPVITKVVIDTALGGGDVGLVGIAFGGLLCVAIARGVMTFLRDYSALQTGSSFNFHVTSAVVDHLLMLPLPYFEKRQVGDLIDRYQAVNKVREILIGNVPILLLDGLVSIVSISILFAIWPIQAMVSIAVAGSFLALRFLLFNRLRSHTEQVIHARAREHGFVIETLRAMLTVKTAARESDRRAIWAQRYAEFLNTERKLAGTLAITNACAACLLGIDIAISLYIGSTAVLLHDVTLGTLFATLLYKTMFGMKAVQFVNGLFEVRLLDAHLMRVSDVLLAKREDEVTDRESNPKAVKLRGEVALRSVTYSYSPSSRPVLRNLELTIPRGQFIAIAGESGAGKSTLLKVILGLYRPDSGQVVFDGVCANRILTRSYRSQIGTVMQEDTLMVGSLLDNICFFDPIVNEERAIQCAIAACIDDDIRSMPMQYQSRIGDMGSALSAGQRQRVLLARALYRSPAILLMDEGTANLDSATEYRVLDSIAALECTRIFMTHSEHVMKRAHRVYRLVDGQLSSA